MKELYDIEIMNRLDNVMQVSFIEKKLIEKENFLFLPINLIILWAKDEKEELKNLFLEAPDFYYALVNAEIYRIIIQGIKIRAGGNDSMPYKLRLLKQFNNGEVLDLKGEKV